MSSFSLMPCHLRETRFVPIKGAELQVLDWGGLRKKLAPNSDRQTLLNLRLLRMGCFIGLVKNPRVTRGVSNFLLLNPDRSARLDWLLKDQPTFGDRLIEVYRVDDVVWDSVVHEYASSLDLPAWERAGA